MENPIVSWLFETDAVRVCPEGQPFWYTSGKLGPFYINTQFLYGSEEAANALLTVIEQACAGDKLRFYDKVYGEIEKQLAACPIYHQLIDLMTEAARKMDVDFVSGGERRDFFFSMPVARKLGLGHLSIFKDLSSVYTDANGVSMPAEQASLSGKRSVHIADLVTVASSYIRAWIPAVEGLGAKIACSLAVVDRDQGGSKILADAGCPLTTLVVIKPELFDLGKTELKTPAGNLVPCYDLERTVCDVIRSRNKLGTETFLAALKLYAANPKKDLNKLNSYAKKMRVANILRQYLEVLL